MSVLSEAEISVLAGRSFIISITAFAAFVSSTFFLAVSAVVFAFVIFVAAVSTVSWSASLLSATAFALFIAVWSVLAISA